MMTGNTPSDPPSDPSSASTEPSPAPSEPVEGASVAGTARRLSGQIGLGAVMVLCGVLLATTARISGGESIRSESGDVADVLRDRDGAITQLSQGAADKRSEIEELSGQRADTDTEERTRTVSDAVGLSAVSGTAVRDRKSTRLNSSHVAISYAVFCLKKKNGDRAPHEKPSDRQRG